MAEVTMFALFFYHRNFMFVILTLLLCSIICQILLGVTYHRLIRETENMSVTKNKSIQQLKLKFTGCTQLRETIPNVPVFVDKYLNQISIGKIPVSFFKHLSGQLTLLAVLVAGIGACIGIIQDESFFMVAPFYLISFLGLYLYFAASSLIDLPSKINILRTNLVDYLENHLASRLDQTRLDMRMAGMEAVSPKSENSKPDLEKTPLIKEAAVNEKAQKADTEDAHVSLQNAERKKNPPAFTPSEAEELELLLREFLV